MNRPRASSTHARNSPADSSENESREGGARESEERNGIRRSRGGPRDRDCEPKRGGCPSAQNKTRKRDSSGGGNAVDIAKNAFTADLRAALRRFFATMPPGRSKFAITARTDVELLAKPTARFPRRRGRLQTAAHFRSIEPIKRSSPPGEPQDHRLRRGANDFRTLAPGRGILPPQPETRR